MIEPVRPRPARASAPLRLDLAGGWTDVPPFSGREGGIVVNATIGLYVHVTVEPGNGDLVLISRDLNQEVRVAGVEELRTDGKLAILQTGVRMYPVFPATIASHSEAPAGSGLGSSGALDVALVSALLDSRGEQLDREAIARAAWRLEVGEVGMPGGKQDQWASAHGGFRRFTFHDPVVESGRIEMDAGFLDHLQRHMVLCYTGTSRISGKMISRVMNGYEAGNQAIVGALRGMKEVAARMVEALEAGDPELVGRLLSENWQLQCQLDPGMRTDDMARLEHAVARVGVLGGKAAGAGAGGCMFFLASGDPGEVGEAARRAGASVLPLAWTMGGVRHGD
jgi:D-glycero-alpha-D-manno-heptose-7-phosphate kinase